MNAMAAAIQNPPGTLPLASYDGSAIAPANLVTKNPIAGSDCGATAPLIPRPAGSTAGVNALIAERAAAAVTTRRPCLDYARSSDNAANFPGTGLTWVPFAADAVTIVTRNDSPLTTNFRNDAASANFLRQLYSCTLPAATASQYRPLIPQAGSGTRSFFLRAIGATLNLRASEGGTCDNTWGPSALDTTGATAVPLIENAGNRLNDRRNVIPYSIADYNAQASGAVTDISGSTKMRRVAETSPTGVIPDIDNMAFPYRRPVFNVIPSVNAGSNDPPDADPDLDGVQQGTDQFYGAVFVGNNSIICSRKDIIQGNGFGLLSNPDPLLPPGNTGCGDSFTIKGGPTVVTGNPTP